MTPDENEVRAAAAAAFDKHAAEGGDDAGEAEVDDTAGAEGETTTETNVEITDRGDDAGEEGATEKKEKARKDGRDGKGRFAAREAAEKKKTDELAAAAAKTAVIDPKAAAKVDPAAAAASATKPPAGWAPQAREEWAKIPAAVQAEVLKRERETATAIQQTTEARRLQQTIAPYEALLRANGGGDAHRAIGGLLNTAAALHMAPPRQRASIIAGLAKSYGVDMNDLDQELAALHGAAPAAGQGGGGPPAQYRDPRVDQIVSAIQSGQQQRAQALLAKTQTDLTAFGEKHEFYEDLREEMGHDMEVAARAGRTLSLEQAYVRACKNDERISKILQQREESQRASTASAATKRAKAASSGLKSQPASQPGEDEEENDDVRATVVKAWTKHAG